MFNKTTKTNKTIISLLLIFSLMFLLTACGETNNSVNNSKDSKTVSTITVFNESVPAFTDKAYVEINNNIPFFTKDEITIEEFEEYSELDKLGRCGVAFANISPYTMPTEDRGAIGMIKPSGWQTVKYDCVEGKYLYNRCHLIGYQLAGENANEKNLITGTRYLNIEGMLDFENEIADYVERTGYHVLYRVTPIFEGNNLLCYGVVMEAFSVEDNGKGICFNVFAYNAQPSINIDYLTGNNWQEGNIKPDTSPEKEYTENPDGIIYIINTNSKKFHYEDCKNASIIKENNREAFNGTVEWLLDNGYSPCGVCKPN